jgi:chromosome segregation ATPase
MVIAGTMLLALALAGQNYEGSPDPAAQPPRQQARARDAETAALRRSIDALSRQVAALRELLAAEQTNDMRRFNANVARLQLVQADIDRMKKERAELQQRLRNAQGRQDDANYRLANVQREIITSGELDRRAGEDRLRAAYERQLNQATGEVVDAQEELDRLDVRIERSEQIADTLRRRLKIDDSQIDVVDEPRPAAAEPEPPPAENPRDE